MSHVFGPPNDDARQSSQQDSHFFRVAKYYRWLVFAIAGKIAFGIVVAGCALSLDSEMFKSLLSHPALVCVDYLLHGFCLAAIFSMVRELTNFYVAFACLLLLAVPNPYGDLLFGPILLGLYIFVTLYLKKLGFRIGLFGLDSHRL